LVINQKGEIGCGSLRYHVWDIWHYVGAHVFLESSIWKETGFEGGNQVSFECAELGNFGIRY